MTAMPAHDLSCVEIIAQETLDNNCATANSANTKSITSIADLEGEYVVSYSALTSSSYDGGSCVSITAIEGTDSIAITSVISTLYDKGASIKAHVDLSTMTITIPNQSTLVAASPTSYGYIDVAYCTSTGAADRSTPITATIADDGTITYNTWWGLYYTNKQSLYYGLYYNTVYTRTNSTMSYDVHNKSTGKNTTYSFGVVVEQASDSILKVKNFFNKGNTLEIVLRSDSTARIESQFVNGYSAGERYSYAVVYSSDTSSISSYTPTITCDKATNGNTISWGSWHALIVSGSTIRFKVELPQNGKIEMPFNITYPEAATMQLEGNGTADSPYLISTASEWNYFAKYIAGTGDDMTGKYARLTTDIDFTGMTMLPLGYDRAPNFNGDLDGNGKTISGFNLTADTQYFGPLAPVTGENAFIHDLTVDGSVSSGAICLGGVVGDLYGNMDNVTSKVSVTGGGMYTSGLVALAEAGTKITNCVNEGAVTSPKVYTAGLVAWSMDDVTYENCGNKGTITYTGTKNYSQTAGLVANARPCTMTSCYNEGKITLVDDSAGHVAGLIYYARSSSSNDTSAFVIKNCYNTADITGANGTAGLIAHGDDSINLTMEDCYNTGNITSTAPSTSDTEIYTAGIAGVYFPNSTYNGCWNSGIISAGELGYAGGLFSCYQSTGSSSSVTRIYGCHNEGEVSTTARYAGGIVAYVNTYTYIDSCYNTGAVSAQKSCGGIVGYARSLNSISGCWNAGAVAATLNRAGGIVGEGSLVNSIAECFNSGSVSTTCEVKGIDSDASGCAIGGIAGMFGGTITDVYNTGSIEGASYTGGLLGCSTSLSSVNISRGYSAGSIKAPADSCGNIVGCSTASASRYWLTSNSLESTYFLVDKDAVADTVVKDTVSIGLSYAELAKLDLGSAWAAGDSYTYPRITSIADNDYAKAYAAAVVPADGDSYSSITTGFNVGTPDGVTWTASSGSVEIDGNNVTFSENFSGTLTMTATSGDVSVATELNCINAIGGVGSPISYDSEVMSEAYYSISGIRLSAEQACNLQGICIVVRTYGDGTVKATKIVR